MDSIAQATLVMLEVIRYLKLPVRLYNSASSECFGDSRARRRQRRDDAVLSAQPVRDRESRRALDDGELPRGVRHLRLLRHPLQSRVAAALGALRDEEDRRRRRRHRRRRAQRLTLGRLDVSRDWGYAPEYVEAMWRMLQHDEPDDFVIATGESHTLEELAAAAFAEFGLDWRAARRRRPVPLPRLATSPTAAAIRRRRSGCWGGRRGQSSRSSVKILCEAER